METRAIVAEAVNAAVKDAAAAPDNALTRKDVGPIAMAVTKELAPQVEHLTNTEPFYQSRVTIGAIITLLAGSYTLGLDFADGTPPTVDVFTAQAGVIAGALTTLYGRWIARKPLGE